MPSVTELLLPNVPLRFTRSALDEVRRRTLETCQGLGVIGDDGMSMRKYLAARFELLAALTCPDADEFGLTLVSDFLVYAFYVDDQAEEDERYGKRPDLLRRYFEGHLRALRDGQPAARDDPAGGLFLDMRARLLSRASRAWLARFADDVQDYLLWGTVGGAQHWTDATVPTLGEYVARRGADSGTYCVQTLAEVSGVGELPDHVVHDEKFRALRRLCANVVAFTNDLVSYPKEVRRQASPNNLVHVLVQREQRSFEDALARVIEMINADVAEFEERAQELGPFDAETDARVRRYLAYQRAWMTGSLSWSLVTGRYVDPQSPFPELRGPSSPEVSEPHGQILV